jgi:hypothetical protein
MTENYDLESKPINKEDIEPEQNPLDTERRAMMKKAACAIGAAYIAPVTLNLLLADKANAASGPSGPAVDPPTLPPPPF